MYEFYNIVVTQLIIIWFNRLNTFLKLTGLWHGIIDRMKSLALPQISVHIGKYYLLTIYFNTDRSRGVQNYLKSSWKTAVMLCSAFSIYRIKLNLEYKSWIKIPVETNKYYCKGLYRTRWFKVTVTTDQFYKYIEKNHNYTTVQKLKKKVVS